MIFIIGVLTGVAIVGLVLALVAGVRWLNRWRQYAIALSVYNAVAQSEMLERQALIAARTAWLEGEEARLQARRRYLVNLAGALQNRADEVGFDADSIEA